MDIKLKNRKITFIIIYFFIFGSISIYYLQNKPDGYQFCINNNIVAYVRDRDTFYNIYNTTLKDTKSRFQGFSTKDKVSFNRVKVEDKYLTDLNTIKSSIIGNSGDIVNAYVIESDGRQVSIVASEKEGKEIFEKIKDYYIKKDGLTNVKKAILKNDITYIKKSMKLSEIPSIEENMVKILNMNSQKDKPYVVIELNGELDRIETIEPATVINWDGNLLIGETKIESQGKNGSKSVHRQVIFENKKIKSTKILAENTIKVAEDKIVLKGSKNPVIVGMAFLQVPSRGSISSYFGMRWGSMHEGLDIAASEGSTICSAMDGKVIYTGWEDGYGNLIKIDHGGGLETRYGHCSSISVTNGEQVKKGQKIGEVGSTGRSTGPHVHFEVRIDGVAKNPIDFLK